MGWSALAELEGAWGLRYRVVGSTGRAGAAGTMGCRNVEVHGARGALAELRGAVWLGNVAALWWDAGWLGCTGRAGKCIKAGVQCDWGALAELGLQSELICIGKTGVVPCLPHLSSRPVFSPLAPIHIYSSSVPPLFCPLISLLTILANPVFIRLYHSVFHKNMHTDVFSRSLLKSLCMQSFACPWPCFYLSCFSCYPQQYQTSYSTLGFKSFTNYAHVWLSNIRVLPL